MKDVERLARTVEDAVREAEQLVKRAQDKSAALSAQAADALARAELAADRIGDLVDAAQALVAGGPDGDADLLARADAVAAAATPALAAITDVPLVSLKRFEDGVYNDPSPAQIVRIAEALDIDPARIDHLAC